jgi:integrase
VLADAAGKARRPFAADLRIKRFSPMRAEFRDRSFPPKWGCKGGRQKATLCPVRPSPARVDRDRSREWIFPHECYISCPIRAAAPKVSEQYFFWSGESKRDSATGDWQRALKGVFKEAKIPDGHAQRFRPAFATGLLQAGVPMDRVPALLGHSSIKVTEKHYSPWVRARQEQLEADVRRTWETVFPEKKGPANVQEKRASVN